MKIDSAGPGGRCTASTSPALRAESRRIEEDVAEFVARGGKIQKLKDGDFGERWAHGHAFHRRSGKGAEK